MNPSQPSMAAMTIPQAVELLRDTAPGDVTAEQIEGLRELIERTPTCLPLLGGRRRVDQFLEQAARSLESRIASASLVAETNAAAAQSAAPQVGARRRHVWELAALLLGLTLVVGGMGIYFFGASSISDWFKPVASPKIAEPDQGAATAKATEAKGEDAKRPDVATDGPPAEESGEGLWNGWKIAGSPGAITLTKTVWNLDDPVQPQAATVMVLGAKPAGLEGDRQIDAAHRWLRIELTTAEAPATGTIEIRADDKPLSRVKLEPAHIGTPLLLALDSYLDRRVKLELRFEPESSQSAIAVKTMVLAGQATRVPWTALKPSAAEAGSGSKLSILSDDSILASGPNPGIELYDVTVTLPAEGAAAIRLDALPDAALPEQGPGRGDGGEFLVRRFAAVRTASVRKLDRVPARYVRIELLGPKRALTLAEVEVFSGGQNVAKKKPATQSSTVYGCGAGRAVDGNTQNQFRKGHGSITHTNGEPNPWWAVDLQQEYPIEKVVVWNRGDGCEQELANHRIVLTDGQSKSSWQHDNPFPPVPNVTYGPFILEEQRIPLTAVVVDHSIPGAAPQGMIRDDAPATAGWSGRGARQTSTAVFTLGHAVPGGEHVTFHLVQGAPPQGRNLGRFRLWSTAAPAPHQSEPAVILLPRL